MKNRGHLKQSLYFKGGCDTKLFLTQADRISQFNGAAEQSNKLAVLLSCGGKRQSGQLEDAMGRLGPTAALPGTNTHLFFFFLNSITTLLRD